MLAKFIPQDRDSTQLAVLPHSGGDHSFENEREILYKILYDMRNNVNDMRREIGQLKKQIEDVQAKPATIIGAQPATIPAVTTMAQPQMEDAEAEEYIEPTPVNENLNLNDLSRQMLEKALERNGGNRKKAAQELGISDRTLYRRLKQYGMDK